MNEYLFKYYEQSCAANQSITGSRAVHRQIRQQINLSTFVTAKLELAEMQGKLIKLLNNQIIWYQILKV